MTSQEERAREVLAKHLNAIQAHALSGEYGQYVQIAPAQALAAMLALAAEVREDAAKVADNTAHEARKLQARYTRDHPQWWANENIASAAEDIAAAIRAQGT